MKRFPYLLLFSFLLASCAPAVTPTEKATNTPLPTVTSTFTPEPTITSTVEPLITDVRAWAKEVGEKVMNEAGITVDSYLSQVDASLPEAEKREAAYRLAWAEFLQKELLSDPECISKYSEVTKQSKNTDLPFGVYTAFGLVVGYGKAEPKKPYQISNGVTGVELMLVACKDSYGPTPILMGYDTRK